jgi:hypothetical protein
MEQGFRSDLFLAKDSFRTLDFGWLFWGHVPNLYHESCPY